MRFHFSLKILVISYLFYACNGQSVPADGIQLADTLSYSKKSIDEHSNYFLKEENRLDTTYFRAKYPVFAEGKINDLITDIVHLEGDTSMQEAAHRFINAYNEYVEDNNGRSTATWNRELQVDVIANTPVFLGIRTQQKEYTGGAHGDHFTLYSNFDRQSNKQIVIDDIIQSQHKDEFVKIAEQYFRTKEGLSSDELLNGKYFFEDGKFSLAANFTFEKDDILFHYNVYEIKSYAEGMTELRIPYAAFSHLISDKGLQYIHSIK